MQKELRTHTHTHIKGWQRDGHKHTHTQTHRVSSEGLNLGLLRSGCHGNWRLMWPRDARWVQERAHVVDCCFITEPKIFNDIYRVRGNWIKTEYASRRLIWLIFIRAGWSFSRGRKNPLMWGHDATVMLENCTDNFTGIPLGCYRNWGTSYEFLTLDFLSSLFCWTNRNTDLSFFHRNRPQRAQMMSKDSAHTKLQPARPAAFWHEIQKYPHCEAGCAGLSLSTTTPRGISGLLGDLSIKRLIH